MSLHDHLGTDQDVRLVLSELLKDTLVVPLPLRRIRIHTEYRRRREDLLHIALKLLRTEAEGREVRASAARAELHEPCLVAAVVTAQGAIPVQGQGDVAVRALQRLTAAPAGHEIRVAAPVHEEHDLLLLLELLLHERIEPLREDAPVSLRQLLPQVDDLGLRELRTGVGPLQQLEQLHLAPESGAVDREGRRR